jgi:hypothetical protein
LFGSPTAWIVAAAWNRPLAKLRSSRYRSAIERGAQLVTPGARRKWCWLATLGNFLFGFADLAEDFPCKEGA